jgi:4-amino-4-deoxy-L-arabinose transferase-like glycosyltransferase
LAVVILAAFAIRIYDLGSFPDTVVADEADNMQDAVRVLFHQPPVNGFFGVDWTPQPAFSIYKQAAFLSVFGFNIFAMRLPSALSSSLALIPFYWLLRRQIAWFPALFATCLLATSVWYLNFSRSGWNNIDVCLYMLAAMLFLMLSLDALPTAISQNPKPWFCFAATGFFCALGLYAYPSGRVITLAILAFLPVAWFFNRKYFKELLLGYALLLGVATILFLPQGIYAAQNWEYFNGRASNVFILNSPEFKADPAGVMMLQAERNLRGPWDGSVNNTHPAQYVPSNEPQLDRVTGALALGGMLLSLLMRRFRVRPETWLWWLMLFGGWSLTQLLTGGTPNGARGIGYMPTLVYFAALALDEIAIQLRRIMKRTRLDGSLQPYANRSVLILLALAVFMLAVANGMHYVGWQSNPQTRSARYLYVTAREFPEWAATIAGLAASGRGIMNVFQWRESHPIANISNPYE